MSAYTHTDSPARMQPQGPPPEGPPQGAPQGPPKGPPGPPPPPGPPGYGGAPSDPYAFIDAHVGAPLGAPEDGIETLERQLEELHISLRKRIDRCLDSSERHALSLSRSLPAAVVAADALNKETNACKAKLQQLLDTLKARGALQQEGLATVYVLHGVKRHLEDCSAVAAELHRWHFRVQEAELLLQSLRAGELQEASQQQAVLEAAAVAAALLQAVVLLGALPQYEAMRQTAKKLEHRVLAFVSQLLKESVSVNSLSGFRSAVAAYERLGARLSLLQQLPAALRSLLQREQRVCCVRQQWVWGVHKDKETAQETARGPPLSPPPARGAPQPWGPLLSLTMVC
ncbi:uncharacterized protein EMH_0075420 [Eimeria mitis]|uniref:Uncharacterized protein n=1 Tax=Eimeria mitis TaxID=44415 RepID=U6K435_9EIME|nr:uncharacterized protein EMH_0075420 [Eimeria mitis]CDJ32485.1 hypothetical protein EMH_0075420 [Eimeria mitis]